MLACDSFEFSCILLTKSTFSLSVVEVVEAIKGRVTQLTLEILKMKASKGPGNLSLQMADMRLWLLAPCT